MAGGLWDAYPGDRIPVGDLDEFGGFGGGGGRGYSPPPPGPPPLSGYGYGGPGGGGFPRSRGEWAPRRRRGAMPNQWGGGRAEVWTPQPSQAPRQTGGSDYYDTIMDRFSGDDLGYTHAGGSDADALLDMIIAGRGRGAFGPGGDPRVMEAYDEGANRRGLAMEQSAVLGAEIEGNDPWNQSLARTLARGNAQRTRGDFMNQNRMDAAQRYRDLVDYALKRKAGQFDREKSRGWELEDARIGREQQSRLLPWQIGGEIAGRALGAWAGGGKGSGQVPKGSRYGGGADDIWGHIDRGGW